VKIKFFLAIALTINTLAMLPFMVLNGWSSIQEVFVIAVIFSFTNAILEEFVWRGALLSRFSEQLGEKWAVVITSLGFGLQHYSLGFPWLVCIAFSFGGFFYGVVTVKSKSIITSIIWHIILNFLMVFSGMILK
jgi:membrane protease YdiL (CAAX protease family)